MIFGRFEVLERIKRPGTCNLGRNGRGLKFARASRAYCLTKNPPLINPRSAPAIVVQIVQGFFYARLKPVSLSFTVTKMYHLKPYPYTVRGGMPQALLARLFAS